MSRQSTRRQRRRHPKLRRWTGGPTLAAAAMLLLASCSVDGEGDAGVAQRTRFAHVHDLGVNPTDDRLYVASHTGVFRLESDGFSRVADRYQDTMAFAIAGPDRFLASGHPDLREDLPTFLGLIESTDAARTWTPVSLSGEADFHALETVGGTIYGLDSPSGDLLVSRDGTRWESWGRVPAVDLAADPDGRRVVLYTDPRGGLRRLQSGRAPERTATAPPLTLVDWQPGALVGVGPDGAVKVSADEGATWVSRGRLPGAPQALETGRKRWFAAIDGAILISQDEGDTWTKITTAVDL